MPQHCGSLKNSSNAKFFYENLRSIDALAHLYRRQISAIYGAEAKSQWYENKNWPPSLFCCLDAVATRSASFFVSRLLVCVDFLKYWQPAVIRSTLSRAYRVFPWRGRQLSHIISEKHVVHCDVHREPRPIVVDCELFKALRDCIRPKPFTKRFALVYAHLSCNELFSLFLHSFFRA